MVGTEEIGKDLKLCRGVSEEDIINNEVALDVDISIDLMGDLEGQKAQSDSTIKGSRCKPFDATTTRKNPAIGGTPKTHVMAF